MKEIKEDKLAVVDRDGSNAEPSSFDMEMINRDLTRRQPIHSNEEEPLDPLEWTVRRLIPIPETYYWDYTPPGYTNNNHHNPDWRSQLPYKLKIWHRTIGMADSILRWTDRWIAQPVAGATGLTASRLSYVTDHMTKQEWEEARNRLRARTERSLADIESGRGSVLPQGIDTADRGDAKDAGMKSMRAVTQQTTPMYSIFHWVHGVLLKPTPTLLGGGEENVLSIVYPMPLFFSAESRDVDENIPTEKEGSEHPEETSSQTHTTSLSADIRAQAGQASLSLSDWVNENLVAVRYATLTTIALLTAFGISQTPLFFRYRTVADIPSTLFRTRRKIRGRIMKSESPMEAGLPIRCHVRHLSPLESILTKRMFETLLKWHPFAAAGISPQDNMRDLMKVEIAGVRSTGYYASSTDQPGEWFERLAREHTPVTLQLLGRRIAERAVAPPGQSNMTFLPHKPHKRKIPGLESALDSTAVREFTEENTEQIAVARMYFRPKATQWTPIDIAQSMVRFGRANISSNGLYGSIGAKDRLLDTTESVKDLQADAEYMETLAQAEYKAASESRGMWADHSVRQSRKDIVDEVEFQSTASFWQKLWRQLRGG